ncbi:BED-type domain-containing protein [Citrus sinensis]|nr:BED-type domain-containing protein [Citrus sinensis]
MYGHSRSNSISDDDNQSVQMEGTQKAKRKRPAMKKRSATWNHFTLLEDNPNKCKCNYCGKQYQYHSRRDGITNMRNHILTCPAYKTFREQQEGSQQNLTIEGGEGNASNMVLAKGWSQDACRRAVTKMIIMAELPLSFVDKKGFMHFCSVAIPQFVMPSRRTIERLFAITVDNASTNDVAVNYVTMQLPAWRNDDAIVLAGQYIHVRCCAHILNLIVVSGLNELHASVAAIRNAVKYVRSSTTRLQAFKQCAQQVKCPNGTVVLDCPTSWNSTYLMLMTALKFQAAFDRMAEVDKPYKAYFLKKENNAKRKVFVQNEGKRVVSEVERYLSDPVEDPSNLKLNVLLWWKVNGSKYPILEKIARDVLTVPVSTVAFESAFSTGRRVIDEYWSSLTPCMIEALIYTENSLQAKLFANPVYNLQEDIKEYIFHMELQEEFVRSQASTIETVSDDMGVMDI